MDFLKVILVWSVISLHIININNQKFFKNIAKAKTI